MYGHGYHPSKGCLDSPDGAAGSRVPLRGPGQLVDPRANLRQIDKKDGGRMETAELALFLASGNSNFIVGQIIPFAGGMNKSTG